MRNRVTFSCSISVTVILSSFSLSTILFASSILLMRNNSNASISFLISVKRNSSIFSSCSIRCFSTNASSVSRLITANLLFSSSKIDCAKRSASRACRAFLSTSASMRTFSRRANSASTFCWFSRSISSRCFCSLARLSFNDLISAMRLTLFSSKSVSLCSF